MKIQIRYSFLSISIVCLLYSCTSLLLNSSFESVGVYDEEINLSKLIKGDKEVVFFPMHHIGTASFYKDVAKKTDSLKKRGYFFYLEKVISDKKKDTVLRKYKKISGFPLSESGYLENIDSIFKNKFKPRKELVNQPKYKEFGVDSICSKIVDVTFEQMIDYYEDQYGEIILETCDYETTLVEVTTCKDKKMTKEIREDLIIAFRNRKVVKEVMTDTRKKIAIIYGKNHYDGIRDSLLTKGFEEIHSNP